MTKVIVVSDIHLKLRKRRDFERSRFRSLIKILAESDADIIVFNGDLLDYATPTLDEIREVSVAFSTLQHKTVYLLAGNHEAVTNTSSTYDYIPFKHIEHPDTFMTIDGVNIEFCEWRRIHELKDSPGADILISHYRSSVPGLYSEEVPTKEFTDKYGDIILGDIHDRYSPTTNVHYTSSPYSISASSNTLGKYGYIELVLDTGKYAWRYIDLHLPQKIKVEISYKELKNFKPDPDNLYHLRITGTLQELKNIPNFPNVEVTRLVEFAATKVPKSSKVDKSFIDGLSEKVEEQLDSTDRHRAKSILTQVQGDS